MNGVRSTLVDHTWQAAILGATMPVYSPVSEGVLGEVAPGSSADAARA